MSQKHQSEKDANDVQVPAQDSNDDVIHNLMPPYGTSYFSFLEHKVGGNDGFFLKLDSGITVKWTVTLYTYTTSTGAKPNDPGFEKDGMVYVVALHTGSVTVPSDTCGTLRFGMEVYSDMAIESYPGADSGVDTGNDMWKYPISITRKWPMFKNNGNETFELTAQYADSVTHNHAKQGHELSTVFTITPSNGSQLHGGEYRIFSMDILSSNKLKNWPVKTTLWTQAYEYTDRGGIHAAASEDFSIPLGFDYLGGTVDNKLTPPTGTRYFSMIDHTVTGKSFTLSSGTTEISVDWTFTLYTYVTGAPPSDPDFIEKGGQVYIVVLHTGTIGFPGTEWGELIFEMRFEDPPVETVACFPKNGVSKGDLWEYVVDFDETMAMFKGDKSEPTTFEAHYSQTFTCKGVQYTNGPEFSLVPSNSTYLPAGKQGINGMHVIKHNKLKDWPLRAFYWMKAYSVSGDPDKNPLQEESFKIPLGFTF